MLELNKDLYQLEQELLSPATTQIAIYFSLRGATGFTPFALEVKAGKLPTVHHVYTEREVEALRMGAVQPVASDNIGPGEQTIAVTIRGQDDRGQEQIIAFEETVEKRSEPLLLEVVVTDSSQRGAASAHLTTWH